jgi:hypothetical protein
MKIGGILNRLSGRRFGRILFLLTAFLLLATIVPVEEPRPPPGPAWASLTATPIGLDEDAPHRRRVGQLLFLRGWAVNSEERRFGAISAMHVANGRVIALSDAGTIFLFPLPQSDGVQPLRILPLPYVPGTSKRGRDTESLVVRGAELWIGYEAINAIKRFGQDLSERSSARPAAMRRWRGNSGAEAMVRLPDGRFLVFAEGRDNDDPFSPVLLFEGDPARPGTPAVALRYRRPSGYRVTDAALLPDGRLMILHRRFRLSEGVSASLAVAEVGPLRPGAILAGREIAALGPGLVGENLEALSIASEGGRTVVRLASDDNFMPILRTVLLEFAFDEGERAD